MSTINATIEVGDDSAAIITGLLNRFPKGKRVRVALTEEPTPSAQVPELDEFIAKIEAARRELPDAPWATTEDAMRDLREGERD
jgi:hypothetical protein